MLNTRDVTAPPHLQKSHPGITPLLTAWGRVMKKEIYQARLLSRCFIKQQRKTTLLFFLWKGYNCGGVNNLHGGKKNPSNSPWFPKIMDIP